MMFILPFYWKHIFLKKRYFNNFQELSDYLCNFFYLSRFNRNFRNFFEREKKYLSHDFLLPYIKVGKKCPTFIFKLNFLWFMFIEGATLSSTPHLYSLQYERIMLSPYLLKMPHQNTERFFETNLV